MALLDYQSSVIPTTDVIYDIIRLNGQPWRVDTSVLENWSDAHFASYALTLTQQGTSGYYTAAFPATAPAGWYTVVTYLQTGGSPSLVADTQVNSEGNVYWPGYNATTSTAGPDDLTNLTYVKTHCQIAVSTYDTVLQQYLTAASVAATNYVGRRLQSTAYTEVRNGRNTDWVRVWNYPIISLSQVILQYQDTGAQTISGTEFLFQADTGIVKFKNNSTYWQLFGNGFQNVRIDYTGGYSTIPMDVQFAIASMVKTAMFSQKLANAYKQSQKVKDVTITYFDPMRLNLTDPIFSEAASILEQYRDRRYV